MLFKNVASQKIHIYAYDSTTGAAKTGDAANITAYVSLDGTANAVDDTNPAEVDATNMPGVYVFDLTQAETNCDSFALYAKSSTSNIRIEPIIGFTTGAAVTQTGDSYAIVNGDHGLVSVQDDIDTLLTRIVGTIDSGTHKPQSGDAYAKVNDATIGLANLKALIDAMQADIGDASGSTLGSLYAILGNAAAALTGRIPAALESGNIPAVVKAQDNIDFGALQKASITAAVPTAAQIKTALEAAGGYLALIKTAAEAVDTLTKASGDGDLAALLTAALAIKIKTDKMTYTSGNDLDVNVQKVNDTALTGNGSAGTPWGPA